MKQVLIIAILVFSVAALNATENGKNTKADDTKGEVAIALSGSITDEVSGESLVGVEVKIKGTDLTTYTDFDGNFSFNNVKPGDYKITANYISYQKKEQTLKVSTKQNNLDLKLQASN